MKKEIAALDMHELRVCPVYTGSIGDFRYRFCTERDAGLSDKLGVDIYKVEVATYTKLCYEKADDVETEHFVVVNGDPAAIKAEEFTIENGDLTEMKAWLSAQYHAKTEQYIMLNGDLSAMREWMNAQYYKYLPDAPVE